MFDLTAADYSLLSWIQQSGIPAHSLSLRFHPGCLMVQCQTIEDATKLWERRSILQLSGIELCFRVNGVFYLATAIK
ncbi:hypothetical protein H6S82_30585 [Planktothrix sp. FACHB-1355]|uniref:Uncharacterized protein n=1 Tax=Aerosakkonema funiforme FACHB-1375 TaxID=2949571 RepID=A0A926ZID0_9CYAN|nr:MULTISPECIES: hypothetical protein [Oscillatoriales]MBD2183564.1 hypothetical protein [Aerosakkonema funiforme FACHB-1375]MBD3563154.1 hypothetical protein [Planktothrix sp. FACHB-1355]